MAENGSSPETIPYGYVDPDEGYEQYAEGRRADWEEYNRLAGREAMLLGMGSEQTFKDEYLHQQGWAPEQFEAAQDAYNARQRAIGMEADPRFDAAIGAARDRMLQNRAAQAGLIGTLADRAQMGGTSAAQWGSRAGFNELANEVSAQAAGDPRLAMRAMAAGGGALAQQSAQAQAAEGLGRQGALLGQVGNVRGVDLRQAAAEQQQIADTQRWQAAKEAAGRRWADLALKNRGLDIDVEGNILRAQAGAEGGVNWQNLTGGLLGAAASGLGTYASMGGFNQGAAPGGGHVIGYSQPMGGGGADSIVGAGMGGYGAGSAYGAGAVQAARNVLPTYGYAPGAPKAY